jgi:peptidoglycan/xylan/chitin deacetylase (PgdA/CDA1 family)
MPRSSLPDRSSQVLRRALGGARALALMAGGRVEEHGMKVRGSLVLAYHDIGDDPENRTRYYVSPGRLREQLLTLAGFGLRYVPLAELLGRLEAGIPADGLASVVFDDGLVGVHHHALPVLAELGLPATVFVVADRLGTDPPWWSGAARTMTAREVAEVAEAGMAIESHTLSHPSLPSLGARALTEELRASKARLEELVQEEVSVIAYPFGHFDDRVCKTAAETGYRAGFSFLNGRVTLGQDPFRYPRLNMWSGQRRWRLAYHVARPPESWPPTQVKQVRHRLVIP